MSEFLTKPLRSLTTRGKNGDFRQWVILPSRSQSLPTKPRTTTIEATCKEQLRGSSTTEGSGSSMPRMEKNLLPSHQPSQLDFDALKEGESVEFEVERGDKGPRAINVRTNRA